MSQATLEGPSPVDGEAVVEVSIVEPKPSGPIVARAQIRSTTKKVMVTAQAPMKSFSRRCGGIQMKGRLSMQKRKYARNCADVIPVEVGRVLCMCASRFGSQDRSIR